MVAASAQRVDVCRIEVRPLAHARSYNVLDDVTSIVVATSVSEWSGISNEVHSLALAAATVLALRLLNSRRSLFRLHCFLLRHGLSAGTKPVSNKIAASSPRDRTPRALCGPLALSRSPIPVRPTTNSRATVLPLGPVRRSAARQGPHGLRLA